MRRTENQKACRAIQTIVIPLIFMLCLMGVLAGPVSAASDQNYISIEQAALQLRDALLERRAELTLYVRDDTGLSTGDIMNRLLDGACSEENAVGFTAGDYLSHVLYDVGARGIQFGFHTYDYISYEVHITNITYKTTAAQEAQFAQTLEQVMDELDLWGVSDYQKYKGIYQYITSHVTYDYDAYYTSLSGGGEGGLPYTAYAALMRGKAVCQGYASLFYAMCKYMNLPVRMVSGIADGLGGWGGHAWNIVKLGDRWYQVDSTWDAEYPPERWRYFLLGSNYISDHHLEEEYTTAAFVQSYPMSWDNYQTTAQDDLPVCRFQDISQSDYYYQAAWTLSELGLMAGTSPTTFSPNVTMSRAMLITILYRKAGSPDIGSYSGFSDVDSGAWYARPVAWAVANGIASGYEDGTFRPDNVVTREQMALFLYKTAGSNAPAARNVYLNEFSDAGQISGYAQQALRWALGLGIIQGTAGSTLSPQGQATRGQAAAVLYLLIQSENAA